MTPTDADRKAAATYATDQETAEKVLAGALDDHLVVQAFASHAEAARREERKAVVRWLRGYTDCQDEATAIEQGAHHE